MILISHTILYVDDQRTSADFYAAVLNKPPRLNAPGMTEFELTPGAILGLMPKTGILRLLGGGLPTADAPSGLLRAELYMLVDDPAEYHRRALAAGAQPVSDLAARDWGHMAAYCLDPDGHVLAFAAELGDQPPDTTA
jgi:catechol 2,3-dioxygenase-like lactoylglutathione lyase family enzyme